MTPQQTQRDKALEKANDTRIFRAEVKAMITAGEQRPYEVFDNEDPRLDQMRVADLLLATPGVGRDKVSRWVEEARITWRTELRFLLPQQRARLTVLVDRHYRISKRARRAEAAAVVAVAA